MGYATRKIEEPLSGLEEDPLDDTWHAYTGRESQVWKPEKEVNEDLIIASLAKVEIPKLPKLKPSQYTSLAFWMPTEEGDVGGDGRGYSKFSFDGRRHLRRIYDSPCKRILLVCGRQVEKTLRVSSNILSSSGAWVKAGDIAVGDRLATMDVANPAYTTTGTVSWVSRRYYKPCVRITTRQGHVCEVATTHPMRVWNGWKEAGEIALGARLAVVRRAGEFYGDVDDGEQWVKLCAYLIADGGLTEGVTLNKLSNCAGLKRKLEKVGLAGKLSAEKEVPVGVFRYSREHTALFLNRLWSCDGHVKQNMPTKYSIEYASISLKLTRQVQSLLWKFGIPTSFRKYQPGVYQGTDKYSYIIRVETQDGIRTFLRDIGALGKSEGVEEPTGGSNNNRDTFPEELNEEIKDLLSARACPRRGIGSKENSMHSFGVREKPKYPLTKDKLREYIDVLRQVPVPQDRVAEIAKHLSTDLYWDSVVELEHIGLCECVDFSVEETENFTCDGFITHNSTMLGNKALCYMSLVPAFRVLYVSPSATQTTTFSNDRIKEAIETSPILRRFTTKMLSANILEKQFVNRSKITLRYAFLNADRTRGIPAWMLELDEFQDILSDSIPVIEQCLAHAPPRWRVYLYAGTPKSLDNNIEYLRVNSSTQGEWVVPHDCKSGDAGRHWNILGEKNIGKRGLICDRCGTLINPMHEDAHWASMIKWDPVKVPFESYRISQLMVPWKPWNEVLIQYEKYPRDKFYNEVLGISYDSGLRPLTRAQVQACCRQDLSMSDIEKYRQLGYNQPVFAGIDWGSGENTYTVLTLAIYVDMKFRVFFWHRFVGEEIDPDVQIANIIELVKYFNVRIIGTDYGGGYDRNHRLVREFGANRVFTFQYMGRTHKKLWWDGKMMPPRFKAARTEVMSDIFNAIKRKQCEFPRWEEMMDPYAMDMTNIYSEYNETVRQIQYKRAQDRPDDSFHSLVYCWLVSMLLIPRRDIVAPVREVDGKPVDDWTGPVYQG